MEKLENLDKIQECIEKAREEVEELFRQNIEKRKYQEIIKTQAELALEQTENEERIIRKYIDTVDILANYIFD